MTSHVKPAVSHLLCSLATLQEAIPSIPELRIAVFCFDCVWQCRQVRMLNGPSESLYGMTTKLKNHMTFQRTANCKSADIGVAQYVTLARKSKAYQAQYGSKPSEKDEIKRVASDTRRNYGLLKCSFAIGLGPSFLSGQ